MPLGGGGGAAYPETVSLYAPASSSSEVRLRPATPDDAELLAIWDREPHVIACSIDDPEADIAFGGIQWREEPEDQSEISVYRLAEADGRPIGAMQVCDPHLESTHYWGDTEPNLRAIDIWIGPKDALNRGYGTRMMTLALDAAFAAPEVVAVVIDPLNTNTDAHRFYQRLGFAVVGRRMFGEDDCLVMTLKRADWRAKSTKALVTPAEAKRRAGTDSSTQGAGPAHEPGRTRCAADLGRVSPGSPLTGRPGASGGIGERPGSPLRFGRDDKA